MHIDMNSPSPCLMMSDIMGNWGLIYGGPPPPIPFVFSTLFVLAGKVTYLCIWLLLHNACSVYLLKIKHLLVMNSAILGKIRVPFSMHQVCTTSQGIHERLLFEERQ